jgi:5-methylthioadenosine/S-adenosylhomocysteine deaminase
LGMGDQIGSLEPGKFADLAVVCLSASAQQPINDIEATLVFSSNGRDVVKTFVNGQLVTA